MVSPNDTLTNETEIGSVLGYPQLSTRCRSSSVTSVRASGQAPVTVTSSFHRHDALTEAYLNLPLREQRETLYTLTGTRGLQITHSAVTSES